MITLVDFVRDSEVKTQYVTEDLTVGPGLQKVTALYSFKPNLLKRKLIKLF